MSIYVLTAGPAALYEIPSVSYVLPDLSRNLFKYRDRAARDSCQNDEYETLTITNIEFYAVDRIETAADDGFTRVGAESRNPMRRQTCPGATRGPSRDQIFRSSVAN